MRKRHVPADEIAYIQQSWVVGDDGVFYWKRNGGAGVKAGDKVGVMTSKTGHQACVLYYDKKLRGYSCGKAAWIIFYGEDPGAEIDHIDCNPQNHVVSNLRKATRAEQCQNRRSGKLNRKNKGVYKRNYGDYWTAQIWKDGKAYTLGTFKSENEAVQARVAAAKELHGAFANLQSYT
jgi:hypothetical protein